MAVAVPRSFYRAPLALSLLASLVLSACGGGSGDSAADAATQAADAEAQLASATVPSDEAQPSESDPPALLSDGSPAPTVQAQATVKDTEEQVLVGEHLFHDKALSASGKMACASCHQEAFGHADAPGTRLPLGGPELNLSGMRSSPTVRYLNSAPPFRLSLLGTPSGGFLWDGRVDDRFGQVFHNGPFFNPVEQALPGSATSPKALTDKVRAADYWPQLAALYASNPSKIATDQGLFTEVAKLIEIYQRSDEDYFPFSSKFDQVQAGSASFTASEARGWALFTNPLRGNCVSCHSAAMGNRQSVFTNFGYAALGVPRNHLGPKNADPNYYDLGLCGREKAGTNTLVDLLVKAPRYCGLFKTPTLRNVARTAPYFHNAALSTLEDAVRFHFERDIQPQQWYRTASGEVDRRYNDLPWYYQGNIAHGRPFNGAYRASDQDIADIVAFLNTLNDADQTEPLN